MGLAFFGLTSDIAQQVRFNLFRQIHEIVFHGKGGYDWNTIYNMPVWLRKFTFNQIRTHYEDEKKSYDKATDSKSKTVVDSSGKIKSPEFFKQPLKSTSSPTYKTRTSKK